MATERLDLKIDYEKSINRAAELIKNDGIVAIPTETVYGLAASAYNVSAVQNIFKAKGRPQDNPLIVHIAHIDTLEKIAKNVPNTAYECAEKFWPGPLTMVLERQDIIPSSVSAGLDTVAVRMPNHTVALDIIKKSGLPLAAPSANTSGKPSPTTANHVIEDLDGKIDAVVIGENCNVGVESTVITLCTNPPKLLRPGAVTLEELREIIPDIIVDKAVLSQLEKGDKASSPGMKYKHYAPKTDAFLVEASTENFVKFVNSKEDITALCFNEEEDKILGSKLCYGTERDQLTLAQNVFSVLRKADKLPTKAIYIHAPKKTGVGLAVYNRLIRAAAFRVIEL